MVIIKIHLQCRGLVQDNFRTALHWAAKRGYEDIVRLLLQNGANPDVTNNEGQKPARFSSSMAISKLLGAKTFNQMEKENLSFTPNYIENPPLFVDLLDVELMRRLPAAVNVPQLHLKQQKEVPENGKIISNSFNYATNIICFRCYDTSTN